MISFDGTSHEVCTARRIRTNTPLQALVTLNDSVYLEAAGRLASRVRTMVASDPSKQISKAYELAMQQPISEEKTKAFEKLYKTALAKLKSPQDALSVVTSAMMNMDEFITKN